MDRRQLLRSLRSGLAASLLPSFLSAPANAAKRVPPTALLVPLTGLHAALGRSMARAAAFAQAADAGALFTLDTGGLPAGAAAAATQALRRGAGLILGPVFTEEVHPVLAAVGGRVPVIAFSNDAALIESGAFLLGITAEQAVAPLLGYARRRGVRRVALAAATTLWERQIEVAAARAAQREGMSLSSVERIETATNAVVDAVLLAGSADIVPAVRAARTNGVQPLAAFAGLDPDSIALGQLEGLWLSAPDPAPFAAFAQSFEAGNGAPPGVIAGLARDAAGIAVTLRQGGGTDRSAIIGAPVFPGVCGDVHFRADGSASRTMAILTVENGRYRVADRGLSAELQRSSEEFNGLSHPDFV